MQSLHRARKTPFNTKYARESLPTNLWTPGGRIQRDRNSSELSNDTYHRIFTDVGNEREDLDGLEIVWRRCQQKGLFLHVHVSNCGVVVFEQPA